jgi:hypothetical protein
MCDIQEKILYQFFCKFLGVLRMQTIISSRFNIKLVAHKAKNKWIAGNSRVLTSRCPLYRFILSHLCFTSCIDSLFCASLAAIQDLTNTNISNWMRLVLKGTIGLRLGLIGRVTKCRGIQSFFARGDYHSSCGQRITPSCETHTFLVVESK